MNFAEFDFQMKRIVDAFDKTRGFYGKERSEAIFQACEHLDARDFQRMVSDMIMRLKDRPVPDDFVKAAAAYRRHYPKPHAISENELFPDCRNCLDVGFIRVRYHDDTTMASASLMRCVCEKGIRHPELFVPTWERGLEAAFAWAPCPTEWFKPKDLETRREGVTYYLLLENLAKWKDRLKKAHDHWTKQRIQETGT